MFKQPLKDLWKPQADVVDRLACQIYDKRQSRPVGQVTAVALGQDMTLQSSSLTAPQCTRLFLRDDEPGAVELDACIGNLAIRQQLDSPADVGAESQVGVHQASPFTHADIDLISSGSPLFDDRQEPAFFSDGCAN